MTRLALALAAGALVLAGCGGGDAVAAPSGFRAHLTNAGCGFDGTYLTCLHNGTHQGTVLGPTQLPPYITGGIATTPLPKYRLRRGQHLRLSPRLSCVGLARRPGFLCRYTGVVSNQYVWATPSGLRVREAPR